jgi:hypothetical protein
MCGEHAALQDAHRALVAKDLMKSGLLKDRCVGEFVCGAMDWGLLCWGM